MTLRATCERREVAVYRRCLEQLIAQPPTLDTAFPAIEWRTKRHGSRSTVIGMMVEGDLKVSLKASLEAIDKADIPNQLFGYLSKLAGPGADMVPSRHLIPELKSLLEAGLAKHRARIAGSLAVTKVAKEKLGAFSQEMEFLKAFQAAHDTPIEDQDEDDGEE